MMNYYYEYRFLLEHGGKHSQDAIETLLRDFRRLDDKEQEEMLKYAKKDLDKSDRG